MNESLQQQLQPLQHTILEQLGVLAVKISLSPIELQMPPEVTNRTSSLSFFICQRDIFEILSGTDMYLHRLTIEKKNDHIYGFIDPVAIQGVGNQGEEVQNYLLEAFVNGKKQVYLAPYLQQVVEAYSKLQGTHIVSRKKLQFIAPTIFDDTSPMEQHVIKDVRKQ
ncbi:hypothetical protein LR48_Vigan05g147300 [Vigna angularis]|uniref:Uncharacterized protein n=1 Tax=Phaseolus angularis TaxID=3914 RepID=A0A0L9UM83_PHAAN|nr:hypothetical protein LR48_Vigan05g147300 [Vigna angularis]